MSFEIPAVSWGMATIGQGDDWWSFTDPSHGTWRASRTDDMLFNVTTETPTGGHPPVWQEEWFGNAEMHLDFHSAIVPEPSAVVLFVIGVVALAARRRK